jgi:hypothetical protein
MNDKTSGNKLYITIIPMNTEKTEEIQTIYKIIAASKSGFLEYMYYVSSDTWKIVAKFKDRYPPEYKAKLRKALFEFNKSELNTVESMTLPIKDKVQSLFGHGTVSLIKGSAFLKELKLHEASMIPKISSKPRYKSYETLCKEFSKFMHKHQLMLLEKSDTFLDINHKKVTYEEVMDLLREDGLGEKYTTDTFEKLSSRISNTGVAGLIFRSYNNIPEYRPRRKYIEFSDCIYDILELKEIDKQIDLLDSDGSIVHPCYKFDKPFAYYTQIIPYHSFIQLIKYTEPDMFEYTFNQFLNNYTPEESHLPREINDSSRKMRYDGVIVSLGNESLIYIPQHLKTAYMKVPENFMVLDPNYFTDVPIEGYIIVNIMTSMHEVEKRVKNIVEQIQHSNSSSQ